MYRDAGPPHWKYICINLQFGGQRRDEFLSRTGDRRSLVGSSKVYVSVCLSVFMYVCLSLWSSACNRAVKRGSLGASLVLADWQVRVFWSYVLVDIPSYHMYVCTIPLSGIMDRRSCYIPFSYQALLAYYRKT